MSSAARHDRLDALRGLAMVWMTVFHFCFDLNHFGHIRQDFYGDPFWTWQRTAIVSLFLWGVYAGHKAGLGRLRRISFGIGYGFMGLFVLLVELALTH